MSFQAEVKDLRKILCYAQDDCKQKLKTKTKWKQQQQQKHGKIDPMHSEIQFKVKHMMVSTVTGAFDEFSGKVTPKGEDFENAEVFILCTSRKHQHKK